MITRTYRTRPWLWLGAAVIASVALGFVPWVDMKGGKALLGASVLGSFLEVVSGKAPIGWLWVLVPVLMAWQLVAAALGWCLHSALVVIFFRDPEGSRDRQCESVNLKR